MFHSVYLCSVWCDCQWQLYFRYLNIRTSNTILTAEKLFDEPTKGRKKKKPSNRRFCVLVGHFPRTNDFAKAKKNRNNDQTYAQTYRYIHGGWEWTTWGALRMVSVAYWTLVSTFPLSASLSLLFSFSLSLSFLLRTCRTQHTKKLSPWHVCAFFAHSLSLPLSLHSRTTVCFNADKR